MQDYGLDFKNISINCDNTSAINLTYGERTGACMRIGGAGRTLFDFCLENEKDSLKNILCYLKKCCSVVTMLVPESGALKTFLLNEGFHVHHAKVAPLIYKMIQEDATELEAVLDEPNNWEFHFIEADTVLN